MPASAHLACCNCFEHVKHAVLHRERCVQQPLRLGDLAGGRQVDCQLALGVEHARFLGAEHSSLVAEHLPQFATIAEGNKRLADKFFDYYGEVFKAGALSAREKALIALAVSHTVRNVGGKATDVNQPVPLPQGVSNSAVGEPVEGADEPELLLLGGLGLVLAWLASRARRRTLVAT